jgi:hypothetical protein
MREVTVVRAPARSAQARRSRLTGAALAAAFVLGSCSSGADQEPAAEPGSSPSSPTASESEPATVSPSPISSPSPRKPERPKFAEGRKGKRAFVEYIVDGWGYGLQTNDPSVLIKASGRKPCRGCGALRSELKQREKERWYVQFPGAKVRKVTFRPDGPIEVATAIVDIPASTSFFDDGTFRNDNKARKGARFLIDIRADGKRKKRQWTLVAFSIK